MYTAHDISHKSFFFHNIMQWIIKVCTKKGVAFSVKTNRLKNGSICIFCYRMKRKSVTHISYYMVSCKYNI